MGRPGVPRLLLLGGTLLLAGGCREDAVLVEPIPPAAPAPRPRIARSAVAPNPANVLSAIVTATIRAVDSVTVRYGLAGTQPDSATPVVAQPADSVSIPVLGLLPDTVYALQVVAFGSGRILAGEPLTLRTAALPSDLPFYVTEGPDPSPGFVVFAAGRYGIVIDNTGRVVWYHRFEYGAGLSFEAQPNGSYTARPGTPEPTGPRPWVEVDPLGSVTRTLDCARGLEPRLHDLIAEPDGSYWIMCDDTRVLDLAALGGVSDAVVTATAVQHVAANGALLSSWTPFDHFDLADLPAAARSGPAVNWTHGNALDLDADGDVVVSFRNLSEITKIDVASNKVVWRLGGARNEFAFEGPGATFARQHGLRVTPSGLVLLDNLGDSLDSRVERYAVDAERRVVSLTASYGSSPPVTAQLGGSVQALPNGRTLVSFGSAGRVEEYDAGGRVVWRIEGTAGYIFRAQRIRSLYRPGAGEPR